MNYLALLDKSLFEFFIFLILGSTRNIFLLQAERERAREQDQREKEELEERLREKDAASTKKVIRNIKHLCFVMFQFVQLSHPVICGSFEYKNSLMVLWMMVICRWASSSCQRNKKVRLVLYHYYLLI